MNNARSEQDTRDVTGRKRKLSPSSQTFVRQSRELLSKAFGSEDMGSSSVGIDQVTAGFAERMYEVHRAEVSRLRSVLEQLRAENSRLRETLRRVRGR